jgi:hypothetical protein
MAAVTFVDRGAVNGALGRYDSQKGGRFNANITEYYADDLPAVD